MFYRKLFICLCVATFAISLLFHSFSNFQSSKHIKNTSYNRLGFPFVYENEIDLRVIVLTFDRSKSVKKLLNSLQNLELDGDKAALEIWIDRNEKGEIHKETYQTAINFKWSKGPTRVHNQTKHVGIIGQWINTWRPKRASTFKPKNFTKTTSINIKNYREIALILEDDLSLSAYAYRWLKAAHTKYNGRFDFAGVSLQSDEITAHNSGKKLAGPKNESALMYVCIGTWGFAPSPHYWAEFQDWFHFSRDLSNPKFQPLIPGLVTSSWFSTFLQKGTQDTMWEMWFIYFAQKKQLFTVYNNLEEMNNGNRNSCLSVNRREIGLHYSSKGPNIEYRLLKNWRQNYVDNIPTSPVKLDWNGNRIIFQ